jgi:methionine biosynthesis protein MetW
MARPVEKRTVDMEVIGKWVQPGSRILDLGCGRGELMAYLVQAKQVAATGVDLDFHRISACVQKGLSAYQGDMTAFMRAFPDRFFDRIICARTIHELNDPVGVVLEALRAATTVTVGFVNHGYWKNRVDAVFRGRKVRNDVYTTAWHESRPANPLTVADFEDFCREKGIQVARRALLRGDWRTPCPALPNLFAGYALYDLARA